MQRIFFTPGPAQLHSRSSIFLEDAASASIASISHRSEEFKSIFQRAASGVRALMAVPESYHIFFVGSATEAMERVVQNCVRTHCHHFVNGAFSERFFSIALELGKSPTKKEAPHGDGFELGQEGVSGNVELVCITQNETSTGVAQTVDSIKHFAARHPQTLIAIDVVSSAPAVQLPFHSIDCAFFSVQKLFGLPAGMGVLAVSPRAIEKSNSLRAQGVSTGSYHSFQSLLEFAQKSQTPETPNVLLIYLLARVCEDLLQDGIDALRQKLMKRARQLYTLLAEDIGCSAFVQSPKFQSPYVVTVQAGDATAGIMKKLSLQHIIVGEGYGPLKSSQFRIANFPSISDAQWDLLLDRLNAVLK